MGLSKEKKVKAWAAMYRNGKIFQPATLPMIYVQKTKPKVFKDGTELLIVPITITYKLPLLALHK
jgi:hypothetical protein